MPEEKRLPRRLPDLALGKKFPRVLLNFFPRSWKRAHLVEKSGGAHEPREIAFADHFRAARKMILAWPERPEEILTAFPSARALLDALPEETEYLHLCEAKDSALVQGLFPHAVVEWKDNEIAWHEPEMQSLVRDLRDFGPDTVLILGHSSYPTVLQAVLRATLAPVRIAWESAAGEPFVNTTLQADVSTPLAARGYQCLGLWRHAGFTPREDWMRIQSDPDSRLEMAERWARKQAAPENSWLYVHDAGSGRPLDDALFSFLEEKISERDVPGFTLGALIWNPSGREVPRTGGWLSAPLFMESDLPRMLGVLDGARGAVAYQGFGLHFASLVEVRCLALLKEGEAIYDASGVNKLFEVEWV
jgi:hypothetical protein